MKLLLIAVTILLLSSCSQVQTEQSICNEAGGEWKSMPDACVDMCDAEICAQVITDGCDCGHEKCWTGQECIIN